MILCGPIEAVAVVNQHPLETKVAGSSARDLQGKRGRLSQRYYPGRVRIASERPLVRGLEENVAAFGF